MKNLFNAALNGKVRTVTKSQSVPFALSTQPIIYLFMLIITFLFAACRKNIAPEDNAEEQTRSAGMNSANQELIGSNAALPAQTIAELFQVRAATARYKDTTAARGDGYVNTGIQLPNMGLHFANFGLVGDGKFDLAKPEFLVYNMNPNGNFELVAVEYGVPIDFQHPDIPPAGFSGDADVWDFNTLGLGLWTLHAWVWKTNPDGVFNMENRNVP